MYRFYKSFYFITAILWFNVIQNLISVTVLIQVCTTVTESQCKTDYVQECNTVTERQCRTDFIQECNAVTENVCNTVQVMTINLKYSLIIYISFNFIFIIFYVVRNLGSILISTESGMIAKYSPSALKI